MRDQFDLFPVIKKTAAPQFCSHQSSGSWLVGQQLEAWIQKNFDAASSFFCRKDVPFYSKNDLLLARNILLAGRTPGREEAVRPARLGNPALNPDSFPKNPHSEKQGAFNA